MAVSRQRAPQHWAGGAGHGTHGAVRFLAIVIGLACVTAAATSLASYTSTESPQPSIDSASINTLRKNAKSGTEAQSTELQPSKSPVRVADVTDDWLQALQSSTLFRRNTSEPGRVRDARPRVKSYSHRARTKSQRPPGENIRYQSVRLGDGATYRTMCVRLCDGYYWPISFTATRGEFARDNDVCARSCDSPVALHAYKNPGEEPEDMVDLSGRPYAKLGNAFRHRVGYDPACKCRPHPWETPSRQRHSGYLER